MALAVKFHQRVERFVANTNTWRRECDSDERYPTESSSSVDTISVLEQSLQKHHLLHERITAAYQDVSCLCACACNWWNYTKKKTKVEKVESTQ